MKVVSVIVCCLVLAVNKATAERSAWTWGYGVTDTEDTRRVRAAAETVNAQQRCQAGWTGFKGHCYIIPDMSVTWDTAQTYCNSINGYLAEIQSAAENQFVANLIKSRTRSPTAPRPHDTRAHCGYYEYFARCAWLGLTDRANEGHFVWAASHTMASYANWMTSPKQPDNAYGGLEHCVELYNGGDSRWAYQWNDKGCDCRRAFVCESGKPQPSDFQLPGNMECTCQFGG